MASSTVTMIVALVAIAPAATELETYDRAGRYIGSVLMDHNRCRLMHDNGSGATDGGLLDIDRLLVNHHWLLLNVGWLLHKHGLLLHVGGLLHHDWLVRVGRRTVNRGPGGVPCLVVTRHSVCKDGCGDETGEDFTSRGPFLVTCLSRRC